MRIELGVNPGMSCLLADDPSKSHTNGETDPTALLAWMQSGESETYNVHLPLKSIEENNTAIIHARFADFKPIRFQDAEFPVDRMFVKMFNQVEAAIFADNDESWIIVKGLHDNLKIWIQLTLELVALKLKDRHFFFSRYEDGDWVGTACSSAVKEKILAAQDIYDPLQLACSFDRAVILYDGPLKCLHDIDPYRLVVFTNEDLRRYELEDTAVIDLSEPEFTMRSSFSVFVHFANLRNHIVEDKNMRTLYNACSGDFDTLKSMIDEEDPFFAEIIHETDVYIGGPQDNDRVVEMGRNFFQDIQFDEVKMEKKENRVATTIILANPAKHRDGEEAVLLGPGSDHLDTGESGTFQPNFPRVHSNHHHNLYILSPSKRLFDDAKANPIVFEDIRLPGYLPKMHLPYCKRRWHLGEKGWNNVVESQILFSLSAKILYAMVETVADNPEAIKERSWHLTGLYGTGKSTSLLICQSLWYQRPSRFRVVYVPHPSVFWAKDRSFSKSLLMMIRYAFLRDPIQPRLYQKGGPIWKDLLKKIDSYLQSRNLFLVIIIDHLEEIWDQKDKKGYASWENMAQQCIEVGLRQNFHDGSYKRILLITAASENCSAAPSPDHCFEEEMNIEILNGFNEYEAQWMIDRCLKSGDDAGAIRVRSEAKALGVRPIDIDFTVDEYKLIPTPHSSPRPIITKNDVQYRIHGLEGFVESRFYAFAHEGSKEEDKWKMLLNVEYQKFLDDKAKFQFKWDLIDKRHVKPAMFPYSWDLLGDRFSKEKAAVGALPIPVSNVYEYELWLCDPDFRKAFEKGEPKLYLLPCNEITRKTLHKAHISRLIDRANKKISQNVPGSGAILLNDAFDQDVRFSGMKEIKAYLVSFDNACRPVLSALSEIFTFASITSLDGCYLKRVLDMDFRERLKNCYLQPEYLYLYQMRFHDRFDFCLLQNETCFAVKTSAHSNKTKLWRQLLEAAYLLGTQRAQLLPLLYGKSETASLLFVCGPNPFPRPNNLNRVGQGHRQAVEPPQPTIDCYTKWSIKTLTARVYKLVSEGHVKVHFIPVEDEPEGSFDICKKVMSGVRFHDYYSDFYERDPRPYPICD